MTLWDPTPVASALISPRPRMDGIWFDEEAAAQAVAYFPAYVRMTAGQSRTGGLVSGNIGKPLVLGPWQEWITRQAFGWKQADGTRLYRRVLIWIPRKNGKTEWAAGVSHLALTRLGMLGGEVYSIAANKDQATIVFAAASMMASLSDDLAECYEVTNTSIYCPAQHTVFKPLSGKPTGKHGLKAAVMIGDEAHEWATGDLYAYVRQSMGLWAEPLEWIISTGGKPGGFGYELWDESEKICHGILDDPHTLVVMYRADPRADDVFDPAVWAKANPNLGVSIDRQWFAAEAARARVLPDALVKFKRYHLNIWAEDSDAGIPPEHWAACTSRPDEPDAWRDYADEWRGRPCFGGLDIASVRDTNALLWLFPPGGAADKWGIVIRVWWPRAAVEKARSQARIPIERWESIGAITITPGDRADHEAIERQVIADCERFQVEGLGVDPFNAHQIVTNLTEAGVPLQIVKQNMTTLSLPTKEMMRMILGHEFDHGGQPVLKWQASNVQFREDDAENMMPSKKRATGKIDGISALVNAVALADPRTHVKSYLTTSPMLILPV